MAVALLVAAGSGERLGAGRPKALVELAGRPLVQWSIEALAAVPSVEAIVVALPPGLAPAQTPPHAPAGEAAAGSWGDQPRAAAQAPARTIPDALARALAGTLTVAGGASRSESVRNALAAAPPGDPVLVHDAARPLVSPALVERVLAALDEPGAAGPPPDGAVAAAPVTDTIKQVAAPGRGSPGGHGSPAGPRSSARADTGAGGQPREVARTLDRRELWAVQTPQAFRRAALARALDVPAQVLAQASDDAWLIERAGGRVVVVPSDAPNLKITTPLDLAVAQALVARASPDG